MKALLVTIAENTKAQARDLQSIRTDSYHYVILFSQSEGSDDI